MIPQPTQHSNGCLNKQIVAKNSPQSTVATVALRQRNPWEQVAHHFVREWMKIERLMSQCNGQRNEYYNHNRNGLIVPPKDCSTLDLTNYTVVTNESTVVVHHDGTQHTGAARGESDIRAFCDVFQPILCQLDSFINQYNINDPSKC
jgi:hypothetical protein